MGSKRNFREMAYMWKWFFFATLLQKNFHYIGSITLFICGRENFQWNNIILWKFIFTRFRSKSFLRISNLTWIWQSATWISGRFSVVHMLFLDCGRVLKASFQIAFANFHLKCIVRLLPKALADAHKTFWFLTGNAYLNLLEQ